MSYFYEIEFMDGVKRIVDSRGVMQYRAGPSETRTLVDGWGCSMEYFITSLSQGKALVVVEDFRKHPRVEDDAEAINVVNIRTIKPVESKLDEKMFQEDRRKNEASEKRKREIAKRISEEIAAEGL